MEKQFIWKQHLVIIVLYRTHVIHHFVKLWFAGVLSTGICLIESHFLLPFLFSSISLYFYRSIYICNRFTSFESNYKSNSHFHHLYSLDLKELFYWCHSDNILINMYQPNGDLSCFTTIELKIVNTVGMVWFVILSNSIVSRTQYSYFLFDKWLICLILSEYSNSLQAQ